MLGMESCGSVLFLFLLLTACQTVLSCDKEKAISCLNYENVCGYVEHTEWCLTTHLEGCVYSASDPIMQRWNRTKSLCNLINPHMPCSYPKFQVCLDIMRNIGSMHNDGFCNKTMEINLCLNNFISQCKYGQQFKDMAQEVLTNMTMYNDHCDNNFGAIKDDILEPYNSCYPPRFHECRTYMTYTSNSAMLDDRSCKMMKQAFICFTDFRSQCKDAHQTTLLDMHITNLDLNLALCDAFDSTGTFCAVDMVSQCVQGFRYVDLDNNNIELYCGIHWGAGVCLEAMQAACTDDATIRSHVRAGRSQVNNLDHICDSRQIQDASCNMNHVKDCYADLFSNITGGPTNKMGICRNVNQTVECLQDMMKECTNVNLVPGIEQNIITLESYSRLCLNMWSYDDCFRGLGECQYMEHVQTIMNHNKRDNYDDFMNLPLKTQHTCRDPAGGKQCLLKARDQCRNNVVKATFSKYIVSRMDELFLPCEKIIHVDCLREVKKCEPLLKNITSMELSPTEGWLQEICRPMTQVRDCLQEAQSTCGIDDPMQDNISLVLTKVSQSYLTCDKIGFIVTCQREVMMCEPLVRDFQSMEIPQTALNSSELLQEACRPAILLRECLQEAQTTCEYPPLDDVLSLTLTSLSRLYPICDDFDSDEVDDDGDGAFKTSGYSICFLVLTALVALALP